MNMKSSVLLVSMLTILGCTGEDDERGEGSVSMPQLESSALVFADQGWFRDESYRFYHLDQGPRLIQFSIFRNVQLAGSPDLFSSDENIESYQY